MSLDPRIFYRATWLNFKAAKKNIPVAPTKKFLVAMDFKVFAM